MYGGKRRGPAWLYDNLGMWKDRYVFAAVLLALAALAAVIAVGAISLSRASCEQAGERFGVPANYRFLTGCYLQAKNGDLVPSGSYRAFERERVH